MLTGHDQRRPRQRTQQQWKWCPTRQALAPTPQQQATWCWSTTWVGSWGLGCGHLACQGAHLLQHCVWHGAGVNCMWS